MTGFNRFFVILLSMLVFCAAGCGSKQDENLGIAPDAVVYLAEFLDINVGSGWIQAVAAHDGFLYISAPSGSANRLRKISLTDGTEENIDLFPLAARQYVRALAINGEGNFLLLVGQSLEAGDTCIIYETSAAGEKVSEIDITEILGLDAGTYLQEMYSNNKGNLYFSVYNYRDGLNHLMALDGTGQIIGTISYNEYINSIIITDDGEVYVATLNGVKKAEFATGSFGPDIPLDGAIDPGSLQFAPGGTTGILASTRNGLYECDLENGSFDKLLDFIDCDISPYDVRYFGGLEDGSFWLMNQSHHGSDTGSELIMLKNTTYSELPPREYLTYGAGYLKPDTRNAVVDFNKTNQQYRIQIKEYFTGNFDADIVRINTDISSGTLDIIDLSMIGFYGLAMKGAFADLNNYLDESNMIDRGDYLENAFGAYEVDGKLLGIMPRFSFNALAGPESKLGRITRWNIAEMIDWAGQYPDALLIEKTAVEVIMILVQANLSNFIDWQSNECKFTGEEFLGILEFAQGFGHDDSAFDWNNPNRPGTYEGFRTGKNLLRSQYINSLTELQIADAFFDGEARIIGYPSESGYGIMFKPYSALAINSKSKHKDGAFTFIEYMLSDSVQIRGEATNYYESIPIKKNAIAHFIARETTPQPNIIRSSWQIDDLTVDIERAYNLDYVDTFNDLLAKASGIYDYDNHILQIIEEEAASFFSGQKSALEAAEIIQNRVQVYMKEQQ